MLPQTSANAVSSTTLNGSQRSSFKHLMGSLVRRTGYAITRVEKRTSLVCADIPGWFSVEEAEALYMLVASSSATRILEIGHFLGRSTSVICQAIRAAGHSPEFNSYDLGFTNSEEFAEHFRRVHQGKLGEVPQEYVDLVYSKNKTTTDVAHAYLQHYGLDGFVHLFSGDFTLLDKTRYDLIFCDAVHELHEIRLNLPHVMNASNDGCIWALHDMTPPNIAEVLAISNARLLSVVDTLGIFRFTSKPAA